MLGGLGLVIGLLPAGPAHAAAEPTASYIVQLADLPVASYDGGITGYAATRPADGAKLDDADPDVVKYRDFLTRQHDTVLGRSRTARKVYDYTATFNGFAAQLTSTDAAKLSGTPGVLSVTKDELRSIDTISTPDFLGLTKPGGLWSKLGGTGKAGAGDGVIVGLLDTGLWPEDPSFAPLHASRFQNFKIRGWKGACVTGEQWTAANCSDKVIGARYYTDGFGIDAIKDRFPYEVLSARDVAGHGSHTSSIAAGNFGVPARVGGVTFGNASGMAPNARIAMYKVCWGRQEPGGHCPLSDSMKAIEDATTDGVDVINFSISGSSTSMIDPVESQFMAAADAGVFVAASAGNTGPGAGTVAHNDPWVTTVAAGTHDRTLQADVVLGNGTRFTGAGNGAAVPTSPIVLSSQVGRDGADATQVRLCTPGTLDPAKVAGKIVVCDRGTIVLVDKSRAVREAGGVGAVIVNVTPNNVILQAHTLPTVHLDDVSGVALKQYVTSTANPTASLSQTRPKLGEPAPFVAGFSSRGPALAGNGDLLKPDILAPGVAVLADYSPVNNNGDAFAFLDGTSMSSPHIAGIGALLRQAHPSWSPMMIKSAILTTAAQLDNTGQPLRNDTGTPATPFDYGSGQVTPNSAVDPGLVYDSKLRDWIRFLCGAGQLAADSRDCTRRGSIDPSDLNTPNIAVGELAGSQTVTRTVTNVGLSGFRYTPRVEAPAGFTVKVSPSTLFVLPFTKATYKVTITRTTAPFGKYAFGSLTWTDGRHNVRSQLAVRPVALAAPAEVSGTGASGSRQLSVRSGFTGQLTASAAGLVPATTHPSVLRNPAAGSFNPAAPAAGEHTAKVTVTVPAGSTLARFQTFGADYPAGTDLDLFVYPAGTNQLVGSSASESAEEQVTLTAPTAGDYDVYVDLFGLADGQTEVTATPFDWVLGNTAAGNLTVTPATQQVATGSTPPVTATWTGLTAGKRYLGTVSFSDGTTTVGRTILRVDP